MPGQNYVYRDAGLAGIQALLFPEMFEDRAEVGPVTFVLSVCFDCWNRPGNTGERDRGGVIVRLV